MHIAMIGTRGVPARYGGFETAIEEVGQRLVKMGHKIRVYCRDGNAPETYLGMDRVTLPAARLRIAETLSHTALSVVHLARNPTDVAIVFNAANAPFLPVIRAKHIPVALHVDGLEWKRAKWGPTGRRYYSTMERLGTGLADRLIADAEGIRSYYFDRYHVDCELIAYGAPILCDVPVEPLGDLNLQPHGYHLAVARVEPENHLHEIIRGYAMTRAERPLVVVGGNPYENEYSATIKRLASQDRRVLMLGSVWDQNLLNSLYAHSLTYIHGHSVGGTNPSLLRAMGAGARTLAWDVSFNKEVLQSTGEYFSSPTELAQLIIRAENSLESRTLLGNRARRNAAERYDWDDVAEKYHALCVRLCANHARWSKELANTGHSK
ncbi:MAG: DUF1972 domain-containing protein [Nitrococcus sp.]|nr:DUF1972 domain-containing protein [Nitrococcus sp.]